MSKSVAMGSIGQLSTGPMALQSVKSADLSPLNSLKSGVNLAEVVIEAATRAGMQKKEIAAIFDLSAPDLTAAFSADEKHAQRNRLMKVALPVELARAIALLLCERVGMAVAGPDAERLAIADLLKACANYMQVVKR